MGARSSEDRTRCSEGLRPVEVEGNVPMADDAVLAIGFVTKQFTAAAILQ